MMMAQSYIQGGMITISRTISPKGCKQVGNEIALYHMTKKSLISLAPTNIGVILDAV
jgi:hypothetical protein